RLSIPRDLSAQPQRRRALGIWLPVVGALLSLAAYFVYPVLVHAPHPRPRTATATPRPPLPNEAPLAPPLQTAAIGDTPSIPNDEAKPTPAEVHFIQLAIEGAISLPAVRRALERVRPALNTCYRRATELTGQSHPHKLHLALTIDERGHAQDPQVTNGTVSIADCVSHATDKFWSEPPTSGTVRVSTDLRFGS
ncbi:MAG TPA: hypothetical protein VHZ95_09785, partial [Polyangiales bacterium]|nr:hypothetical protein [Polyangiales bacterium]